MHISPTSKTVVVEPTGIEIVDQDDIKPVIEGVKTMVVVEDHFK